MKKLLKIKYNRSKKDLLIKYIDDDDFITTKEPESDETPRPTMIDAMDGFREHVADILELSEEYCANMTIGTLSITEGTEEDKIICSVNKYLDDSGAVFNFNTPLAEFDGALWDKVVEETKAYLDGDRAQLEMDFGSSEKEEKQEPVEA